MRSALAPHFCNTRRFKRYPMEEILIQSGQVLLAEPFMMDSNFSRAAVLLCEHNQEGSLGFILNKPLQMRVDELVVDFPEFDSEVFLGGPVQTDTLHYLHCRGDIVDESIRVADGVYWGGDFKKLKALIRHQVIEPSEIRFFVGYSGWSEGQLSGEMTYGSWVIANMDANYLFNTKPADLWRRIMENMGDRYTVIAQLPDYSNWN